MGNSRSGPSPCRRKPQPSPLHCFGETTLDVHQAVLQTTKVSTNCVHGVRGEILPRGKTPHLRSGYLPWRRPHGGRGSGQSTSRSGKRRARGRRDTRKGTRRGTESQRTNAQPLIMDDHEFGGDAHKHILEPMWCNTPFSVRTVQEKNDV